MELHLSPAGLLLACILGMSDRWPNLNSGIFFDSMPCLQETYRIAYIGYNTLLISMIRNANEIHRFSEFPAL